MTLDPAQGGRQPRIVPIKTWDLLALPIIGPLLCKLLGGGIGPRKDSQKTTGGQKHGN